MILRLDVFRIIQFIFITRCYGFYHDKSMKEINVTLPKNSFFGYSVTYQAKIRSLVISAPTADKIGQVFIYDIELNNLTKIAFEFKEDENHSSGYWLGAEVKAGDNSFTTCAPRYEVKKGYFNHFFFLWPENRTGTYGLCFHKSFKEPQNIQILHPMTTKDRSRDGTHFEQLMDSLGWSIDITPHNNILIGSPVMSKGRVVEYRNISDHPSLLTPENTTSEDIFNFGYSIASGNYFSTNLNNISYAISTPYGNEGIGQVHFYNETGKYIGQLIDNKLGLGTLFGASLCTVDFGHDRASLIIGAPAYVPDDAHGADLGTVHVYVSSDQSLTLKRTIRGQIFGGRFGSAIVNVGDLDADRRDDVAIAAPYESDGNGAVYIYTSTDILSDKMDITYTQKVQRADFKGFGLSLAALKDYDDNGCNELAVGAPYSNAVVILHCFSAISINIFTLVPNLQKQEATDKEKITVQTCLNVTYANKPEIIEASILVKLSIMHPSAKFEDSNGSTSTYTETLHRNTTVYCRDVAILTPSDKNKLRPIQLTSKAQLENDPRTLKDFKPQRVILTDRSVLSDIKVLWISDCSSKICIPELKPTIVSFIKSPYLIGSSKTENISIAIENSGETAYSPCTRVTIGGVRALLAPGCRRDSSETLICEPRNPLQTNQTWNTGNITLETKTLTSIDNKIIIRVSTFNYCANFTNESSTATTIDLKTDIDKLLLTSEAIPGDIVNVSYVNLDTDISHMYTITNNGVTNWAGIKFLIVLNNLIAEIKTPIFISTDGQKIECYPELLTDTSVGTIATCGMRKIRKNQKIYIMVNLKIPPLSDDVFHTDKNVSIETMLRLMQDYEIKAKSTNSTIVYILPPSLPLWIYFAAGVLAVLVLLILIIIFYEVGFLQRKNKELLQDLKKDVKRQTVRRTMQLREDIRNSRIQGAEDATELLEKSEPKEIETCSSTDIETNS